jgi:glycosyltransferase involved in cell wall biosynthesis
MKFSLVIPCYNEAANLPLLLERCKELSCRPDVEVVLVDNGSTDNTIEVLKNLLPKYPGCRSIRVEKNQGYGYGIVSGLKAAKGRILGWTHADMQTDPLDALSGLELFDKHGDEIFVKGRRYGRPFMDIFFTVGMSVFETLLLARPMWDINAQPTMFSRRFFESWDTPPCDFSLDLYAYYIAKNSEVKVHRFSTYFGKRAHGFSSWNISWKTKQKFIIRSIQYSFQLKNNLRKKN